MTSHLTIPGSLEWDSPEVERLTIATLRYAGGKEHDVRYVSEVHYDAALASETLLKRELEIAAEQVCASEDREAALREELDLLKPALETTFDAAQQVRTERDALQQRLTIAEQRAGEMESAAREMLRIAGIANQGSNAYSRAIINLNAALKPAAEGEGS